MTEHVLYGYYEIKTIAKLFTTGTHSLRLEAPSGGKVLLYQTGIPHVFPTDSPSNRNKGRLNPEYGINVYFGELTNSGSFNDDDNSPGLVLTVSEQLTLNSCIEILNEVRADPFACMLRAGRERCALCMDLRTKKFLSPIDTKTLGLCSNCFTDIFIKSPVDIAHSSPPRFFLSNTATPIISPAPVPSQLLNIDSLCIS